ncbi:MAG TPA: hypothetical protein VF017_13225 [Thermoanaerobaculia bacterium]|nr:hypothetical protein [Thermoanaerobaculia bacterium]
MKVLRLSLMAALLATAVLATSPAQAAPRAAGSGLSWMADLGLDEFWDWLGRFFLAKEGGYVDPDGAKGGSMIDPVGGDKNGAVTDSFGAPRVVRNWGPEGSRAKAGPDIMPDGNKAGPGAMIDGNKSGPGLIPDGNR